MFAQNRITSSGHKDAYDRRLWDLQERSTGFETISSSKENRQQFGSLVLTRF